MSNYSTYNLWNNLHSTRGGAGEFGGGSFVPVLREREARRPVFSCCQLLRYVVKQRMDVFYKQRAHSHVAWISEVLLSGMEHITDGNLSEILIVV